MKRLRRRFHCLLHVRQTVAPELMFNTVALCSRRSDIASANTSSSANPCDHELIPLLDSPYWRSTLSVTMASLSSFMLDSLLSVNG